MSMQLPGQQSADSHSPDPIRPPAPRTPPDTDGLPSRQAPTAKGQVNAFAALANNNFRRFFIGQGVSTAGAWMEGVAQSWLVLTMLDSGFALVLVVAFQTLPVLLLGPYAGVLVDRADKRKLLMATQALFAIQSAVLGTLVLTGLLHVWMIFVSALILGCTSAIDSPTRQVCVSEMVAPDELPNAINLISVMSNTARAIGPALAGITIAIIGSAGCFLINAVSFTGVLAALASMNLTHLYQSEKAPRAKGQLREGLAYVRSAPELVIPLAMMGLIGTLAFEFDVVLPIVARSTFHGEADTYGYMAAEMGIGAMVGGLILAAQKVTGVRALITSAVAFGIAVLATAAAPNLTLATGLLALVGATSVAFLGICSSTLQLVASPSMRGRVMALWTVAFVGSTPIGGPLAGYISEAVDGRTGLALGGTACLLAAAIAAFFLRRVDRRRTPDDTNPPMLHTNISAAH